MYRHLILIFLILTSAAVKAKELPYVNNIYSVNCSSYEEEILTFKVNDSTLEQIYLFPGASKYIVYTYDKYSVEDGGGGQLMIKATSTKTNRSIVGFIDAKTYDTYELKSNGESLFSKGKNVETGVMVPILKNCDQYSLAFKYFQSKKR